MTIGSVRQHRPDDTNPRNLAVSVRRALDGLNAGATPVGGVPVTKFGMRPDARKDQLAAFQSAIDSGEPLMVPAGSYILDGQVKLVSGLRLMAHGATFLFQDQGWTTQGWANSFVTQADVETAISDVLIDGGTWKVDGQHDGNLFAVNINHFIFRNARLEWWYGRAMNFVGDHARIFGLHLESAQTSGGAGAFRVFGGNDGVIAHCYAKSPDDRWQFVPGLDANVNGGLDIRRWSVMNCTGESPTGAGGAACVAQVGSTLGGSSSVVEDIVWSGIVDTCGTYGCAVRFIVYDGSGALGGAVRNVRIQNCSFDGGNLDNSTTLNSIIRIEGPVEDVHLKGVAARAPFKHALLVVSTTDGAASNVDIEGGVYEASRDSGETIYLRGHDAVSIRNATIYGRVDANLVHVGVSGADVAHFEASGNTFRDIGDTAGSTRRYAVNLAFGGMARLTGNTFIEASGATNSTGIRMASTWGNCEAFEDNDFTGIDRDFLSAAPVAIAQPRKTIGNFASPNAGGVVSGSYYDNSAHAQATTTRALSANHFFLAPFFSSVDLTVDRLGLSLTVAGGAGTNGRIVVYSTGPDGWPDALLYESADFLIDAATLCEDTAANFTFKAGAMYWIGGRVESACTARALQNYQSSNLGLSSGSSNTYFTVLLRTLAYATATPTTYGFTAANRTANWAVPSIRMRAA